MNFKQVKQTLKAGAFLGRSANATRWQLRTWLLHNVPLGCAALSSQRGHCFMRLFAMARAAMWEQLGLVGVFQRHQTAAVRFTLMGAAHAAWLHGFELKDATYHETAHA